MTPAEHRAEAERLLAILDADALEPMGDSIEFQCARALIHAVLSLGAES